MQDRRSTDHVLLWIIIVTTCSCVLCTYGLCYHYFVALFPPHSSAIQLFGYLYNRKYVRNKHTVVVIVDVDDGAHERVTASSHIQQLQPLVGTRGWKMQVQIRRTGKQV